MTRQTSKPTQAEPTRPRARDASGNELDGWGIPIAGPLRAALLGKLGRPDPNVEPGAWPSVETETATSASDIKE